MKLYRENVWTNSPSWLKGFLRSESGATTTDYMMIASVVISLGIGAVFVLRDGATIAVTNTSGVMKDGFDPSGLATRPTYVDRPVAADNDYASGYSGDPYGQDYNDYVAYNEADNGDMDGIDVSYTPPSIGDTSTDSQDGTEGQTGDTTADTGGSETAGQDTGGADAGDTTDGTQGDTTGEDTVAGGDTTDGDTAAADTGTGGDDGAASAPVEEPSPWQQYQDLYNELYLTLDTPELDCFRNNGEVRLNKKNRLPKRCRNQGLEELLELQAIVYPA